MVIFGLKVWLCGQLFGRSVFYISGLQDLALRTSPILFAQKKMSSREKMSPAMFSLFAFPLQSAIFNGSLKILTFLKLGRFLHYFSFLRYNYI